MIHMTNKYCLCWFQGLRSRVLTLQRSHVPSVYPTHHCSLLEKLPGSQSLLKQATLGYSCLDHEGASVPLRLPGMRPVGMILSIELLYSSSSWPIHRSLVRLSGQELEAGRGHEERSQSGNAGSSRWLRSRTWIDQPLLVQTHPRVTTD